MRLRRSSLCLLFLLSCCTSLFGEGVKRQVREVFDESPRNSTVVYRQITPVLRRHKPRLARSLDWLWREIHREIYARRDTDLEKAPEERASRNEAILMLHDVDSSRGLPEVISLLPVLREGDLITHIFNPDFETTARRIDKILGQKPSRDFLLGLSDLLEAYEEETPEFQRVLGWVDRVVSNTKDLVVAHNVSTMLDERIDKPYIGVLRTAFLSYLRSLDDDDFHSINESHEIDIELLDEVIENITPLYRGNSDFLENIVRLRKLREEFGLDIEEEAVWKLAKDVGNGSDWEPVSDDIRARAILGDILMNIKALTYSQNAEVRRSRRARTLYNEEYPEAAAQALLDLEDADEAQTFLKEFTRRRHWQPFRFNLLRHLAKLPEGYEFAARNKRCANLLVKLGLEPNRDFPSEAP